jgi:cytochrome c peroxidase
MRTSTAVVFVVTIAASAAARLPKPLVPANNPGTEAKVRLGRYLFYDRRMSVNGTISCATCHRQELAFTDGRAQALGATQQSHPRGAMSLVNVAYESAFNWSDPTVHSLEQQALKPMFSTNPVELGFDFIKADFLKLISSDLIYRPLFRKAFPSEANPYTVIKIAQALAAFERSILSSNSPYDRFHYDDDETAISASAKRGEILFFMDGGPSCFRCHGGFNFSDAVQSEGRPARGESYHNTGLYNLSGMFTYPRPNLGLYDSTRRVADVGKFKAPLSGILVSQRHICMTEVSQPWRMS